MKILWTHVLARIKPLLSYDDLETIFRYYAHQNARNEPIVTYVANRPESDSTTSPVDHIITRASNPLRAISSETTKGEQARSCRVIILDHTESAVEHHYLTVGAAEELRELCLAALVGADTDEDLNIAHDERLWLYCDALWLEDTFSCLYAEQFNSYMALSSFAHQYRAMMELYIRFLCNQYFSMLMDESRRAELQGLSALYHVASIGGMRELADIRKAYRTAIYNGREEALYPLQQQFGQVAESMREDIMIMFGDDNK